MSENLTAVPSLWILIEPFFFPNNLDGFESFIKTVDKFKSSRHIVGLESTGQYGDIFISSLIKHNYGAALTNPLINDAKRKSKISKAKNDKKDTKLTVK